MLESERRSSVEETIRWNYSMISATRELTQHLLTKSSQILQDLWQGALMCGIGDDKKETDLSPTQHSNSNGNTTDSVTSS